MLKISINGTVEDDHVDVLVDTIKALADRLRASDPDERPNTVTQDFTTLGLHCSGEISDS